MNIAILLDMITQAVPDRVAVTEETRSITYGQLRAHANAFADAIHERSPDVILFLGSNGISFAVCLMGAALAGTPLLPLNYRMQAGQLESAIEGFSRGLLLAESRNTELAQQIPAMWRMDAATLCREGLTEWSRIAPTDADVAAYILTSGTTAMPKLAVLRHRHLFSYVSNTVEFMNAAPEEATLVTVPPYHIAGLVNLLTSLYSARRLVYMKDFNAEAWLNTVEMEAVTQAMLVPTMLARVIDEIEQAGRQAPPSLRLLSYGGARTPRSIVERALRVLPNVAFVNVYGLTETSSTIALLTPEDHNLARMGHPDALRRLDSAGRPVPGIDVEVRRDGVVAGPSERGLIWVRGPQVSGEYVSSEPAIDEAGWFYTRDVGFQDEDGYLFIEGRADDTIIRGGENIAPSEIEDVLTDHPAVIEAAAIGIPDEVWGQRIGAVVVTITEVSENELREWVRERLRSSKTPDIIQFCDALPVSETGKLLRRQLLERFLLE